MSPRPLAALWLAAALALTTLARALPAVASTFVMMDETELARQSVAAVRGTVTAIESALDVHSGGVHTYVHLAPDEVLFGTLPPGAIVLREIGGRAGGATEWVFGNPDYRVGEAVLVFVATSADGALRTTAMAMGKFSLTHATDGTVRALRSLGEGAAVWDARAGRLIEQPGAEEYDFDALRQALHAATLRWGDKARRETPPRLAPEELARLSGREARSEFTYLSTPSRWFEPDQGQPIAYRVDAGGDAGLGPATSRAAVQDAFATWTAVATSALTLSDGGDLSAPIAFAGCSGGNRLVFNDPFNEISNPSGCGGILAIGGYCSSSERRTVNGISFRRITVGKVTFNNGWESCWDRCALAEVATHELGHTIGFGHSADSAATMYANAHFDDRCAGLRTDDVNAVTLVYPNLASPTPTPSATPVPPTASRTPTPTVPTATATATATHTPATHRVAGRVRYYANDQGVPEADIRLQGAAAVTSALGDYEFASVVDDGGELVADKDGDIGLGVSALDAVYVLQHVAQLRQLSDRQRLACDVTGDGTLSTLDAVSILQFGVGTLSRLPVVERCASEWIFAPEAAAAPASAVIDPTVTSNACSSGRIILPALGGDAPAQDFNAVLFGDCTGNWQPPGQAPQVYGARRHRPLVRLGRANARQGLAHLPVYIQGPQALNAVDLRLRYDAAHLTPTAVRLRTPVDGAIISWHVSAPGHLRVAVASGTPLRPRRGPLLLVEFSLTGALNSDAIGPESAVVDEQSAAIAGPPPPR